MANLISEFKEFIVKGNAIDLAVGIIIGGAFGGVVQSLVKDVIMPPIGLLLGGVDFSDLKIHLTKDHAVGEENPLTHVVLRSPLPGVTVNYGTFLNTVIQLLIIGFAVFMVVKLINILRREKPKPDAAPPAPPEDIRLLTEIRDALQHRP